MKSIVVALPQAFKVMPLSSLFADSGRPANYTLT